MGWVCYRPFISNVACIECAGWFEQHDFHFFICNRPVFDAVRDNDEVTGLELQDLVAQLHAEAAAHHEEELVLRCVVMPDEGPPELRELDRLPVELAHDPGPPVVTEEQIRDELGLAFRILDLQEFRFDEAPGVPERFLGWSCLVQKR